MTVEAWGTLAGVVVTTVTAIAGLYLKIGRLEGKVNMIHDLVVRLINGGKR